MFSVPSGPGVFTNCVNRWCRQEGPTPPQYTKCGWISNNGRTCHNPEIKFSGVPNKRAARLLIFVKKSLPICLIWTYMFIKFWKFFLPIQLF